MGGVKSDPNSLVKPLVKPLDSGDEENKMRTVEEIKEDTAKACDRSIANLGLIDGVDISGYSESARPVIEECYRIWGLKPPSCSRRSKSGSRAKYWEKGAEDLRSACAEFGVQILSDYRKEFEGYMASHRGLAPHRVDSPNSLVNVIAGKAGEMRLKSREVSQDSPDTPPAIRGIKGRVRYGDKLYFDGKEIADERPAENITGA